MKRTSNILLQVALLAALTATAGHSQSQAGWKMLFNGRTLDGWREYKGGTPSGWFVRDSALTKDKGTVDIITVDEFGDFELSFDWKIAQGGNAGVFYRGTEEYDHVYWSGPEYQLLDDENAADGKLRLTSAGSAFGLYPSPAGILKPAGEWNSTRIVAKGTHVEHWLNGTKLLEYEFWSPDWEAKLQASKFKVWPNYGRAKKGHIAIQGDHNGELALKNIKIREIK